RGASRSSARCPYVIHTGARAGQTCGTVGHTQSCCFSCLSDTWRAESGAAAELPRWLELLRQGVDIFALDYDAILTAMYALPIGTEGDCSLYVLPDPGIEAAALGASESALPGTAPAETLHTFTLDSGASRCFFRDSTTLTPLSAPVPVRLADPSGGPVLARSSTVLPTAALQDAMVTTTTPGDQRVLICTCTRTGCHLATFIRRPGSSLYTLATKPPQVAASAQVSASGPSFTLLDSPEKNGIAKRRIGLVIEVARTSMIHAAAPHFLWPFAVWYAVHQLNLWPHVSLPETLPTLRWTGEVGDASVFRVWGSRAFVRNKSADKLSARATPCVFLGFPPDAPDWQLYHPTSRRVFPSQDVMFDKLVPFYHLFPYRSAPTPPPPLFLAPGPPPVDPLSPQGPAPSGVSQVDPLPGTVHVEIAVDSGAARGAASGGVAFGGAKPGGAEPGGAEPVGVESWGAEREGVEPGGAEFEGAESGGAEPRGTASSGGPTGVSPRLSPRPVPLSPQQLRE
ncbi:unnamed protein product, partial [Closterium sp. NIES-53]